MGVYGSVVPEEVISPDIRQKLVSGKSYVLVFNEVEEKIVLLGSKFHTLAVNGYGPGRNVDLEALEFKH